MEDEPEVIRQRMEESRTSLSEKLDAIEQKVVGVMGGASDAVTDTVETVQASVESVKEAVSDTMQSIRGVFDVPGHFERNPWLSLGGAVVVGFLGARIVGSGKRAVRAYLPSTAPQSAPNQAPLATAAPPASAASEKSSFLDGPLGEAADALKGLAVGCVMGLLRDLAAGQLPESIAKNVAETVDNLTTKLGGKTLPASTFGDFIERCSEESPEESQPREGSAFGAPLPAEEKSGGKNRQSVPAGRR